MTEPSAARQPRRLTDAQLEEMAALTRHADSVELKLTVPDSERRSTVAAMPGGYGCSASFKGALGPGDAVKRVAAGGRAYLAERGVDLYGEQQTKTALEYFSRVLRGGAEA
jgi:hypothetical protein